MSRFIATTKFSGYNSFNTGFNVAYDLYMLPLVYHKNFEDYQKGEGIISDSVTLPDGIEVKKEGK